MRKLIMSSMYGKSAEVFFENKINEVANKFPVTPESLVNIVVNNRNLHLSFNEHLAVAVILKSYSLFPDEIIIEVIKKSTEICNYKSYHKVMSRLCKEFNETQSMNLVTNMIKTRNRMCAKVLIEKFNEVEDLSRRISLSQI